MNAYASVLFFSCLYLSLVFIFMSPLSLSYNASLFCEPIAFVRSLTAAQTSFFIMPPPCRFSYFVVVTKKKKQFQFSNPMRSSGKDAGKRKGRRRDLELAQHYAGDSSSSG